MPISTSTINERALQIMVEQFNFVKANAVEPLTTFLDYMTCVVTFYVLVLPLVSCSLRLVPFWFFAFAPVEVDCMLTAVWYV